VFVAHDVVTAAVVGGYVRSTPINLDFTLDASISRDADISPTSTLASTLSYSWTCTIATIDSIRFVFGTDCGLFGSATTLTTPVIVIKANTMSLNIIYALVVIVTATDGRLASQIVTLSANSIGSPKVSITSTFVKFNAGYYL
jgi:hypothetical protein